MSNSRHPSSPGQAGISPSVPRAVIHKKILDAGANQPEASIEELASDVSGASVELVKQVLEEYGDPAADEQTSGETDTATSSNDETKRNNSNESMATENEALSYHPDVDVDELAEKQRETLRVIYEHPNATQADLAERLGVSSATINTRVNSIPGFEWEEREEIVKTMLENGTESGDATEENEQIVETLSEQVADLEQKITDLRRRDIDTTDSHSITTDPDLTHKIVHACMTSERITEDEELRILRDLIG